MDDGAHDSSESRCFICGFEGNVLVCDLKGCDKVRGRRVFIHQTCV